MELYPAIDLKDGKCVRLYKGDINDATVYNNNAIVQASTFHKIGFRMLHIVDLNGAVSGISVNRDIVRRILEVVPVPVQLGGGIRDRAGAEAWLEAGVSRIILGTAAVKNPALVKELAAAHPDKIVVSIDARDGFAATDGWVQGSETKTLDIAKRAEDAGVAAIIYTDIGRDGTLSGPNMDATLELANAVRVPIILSGGVKTIEHITTLRDSKKIEGVIIGRALYEKTLDIRAAIDICRSGPTSSGPVSSAATAGDIW